MDPYGSVGIHGDDADPWQNEPMSTNGDGADSEYLSLLRKRIAALEWEKAADQRALKERVAELQAQMVHLRNELEKGETERQRLEYDLARCQKGAKTRAKEAASRERDQEASIAQLQEEIRRLEARSEEERAEAGRDAAARKERVEELEGRLQRMRNALEEKMSEAKDLATEKSRVSTEVEILESKLDELRQKFVSMSEECQSLRAEMAERGGEVGAARTRELACRKELEAAVARARQAEEAAERERAAQLEQRYNAELVQARLRETESQLQAEHAAKQEAVQLMEELSSKLRDMEQAWEEEKKMTEGYRKDFDRLREEHMASRACLSDELADKRTACDNLRSACRRLEDELDGVKKEMQQTRTQAEEMDDRHRRLLNDLLGLLEKATPAEEGRPPRSRSPDGPALVEQLRGVLGSQRRRVATANEDAARAKVAAETAGRELRLLREQAAGKEKALQTAAGQAGAAAQEVRTLKRKLVDVERRVSELRAANSEQKRRLDKAAEEAAERKEELQRVKKGRRLEQEERTHFLTDLNRKLAAFEPIAVPGAVAPKSIAATEASSLVARDGSWAQLKGSVSDQLGVLLTSLDKQKDRIHQLEEGARAKERFIEELRRSHEAQLGKYEALHQSFSRQKKETEEHYNKLLQDMQAKGRQSQAQAERAWERIRASGTLQEGLEAEVAALRSAAGRSLAALALLASAHVPLARRADRLLLERRLLARQADLADEARRRLSGLARALSPSPAGEDEEGEEEEEAAGLALHRFRVAAIAVLGANRLRRLGACAGRRQDGLLVPAGGLAAWVGSRELLAAVEESLAGLPQEDAQPEAVHNGAVRGLRALLDRLEADFFPTDPFSPPPSPRPRGRLSSGLGAPSSVPGLASRVARLRPGGPPLHRCLADVEEGVLALSRRLAAADGLAARLREDGEALEARLAAAERRTGSAAALRAALDASVPAEAHRRLQEELERRRAGEAAAQEALGEQAARVEALAARVEELGRAADGRGEEVREAAELLARSRLEVKRREQSLRDLARQVLALEQEKKVLFEKTALADGSLARWRLERDLSLAYLTAVLEMVAESARTHRPQPADVRPLLQAEPGLARVPHGPEATDPDGHVVPGLAAAGEPAQLIACRNVVRALAESAVRWQRKCVTAEEKVAHYRRHVAVLKRELAAACARAVDCPEGLLSAASSLASGATRPSPAPSHERLLGAAPGQSEC